MKNIAVNGFGRIGRCLVRAIYEQNREKEFKIAAINASGDPSVHAHLLKYDSVHGTFEADIESDEDYIIINGDKIKLIAERNPAKINWQELGADIIMECTGAFKKHEDASLHIKTAKAKKVLISSPAPDPDATIVFGVNNQDLKSQDNIISVGSCTTNCLAPVAKVLDEKFGIETGYMTTIHSYTRDQEILDSKHKDLRRARACNMSIIPTSTGAAKAIGLVLPQLIGKLDGTAVRVPTPNVSMVDLTFVPKKTASVQEINKAIEQASNNELKNVLRYCDEPLVSKDFNHDPHSSIFDAGLTKSINNGKLIRVASWYDNEWGFSCRMLDVASIL